MHIRSSRAVRPISIACAFMLFVAVLPRGSTAGTPAPEAASAARALGQDELDRLAAREADAADLRPVTGEGEFATLTMQIFWLSILFASGVFLGAVIGDAQNQ